MAIVGILVAVASAMGGAQAPALPTTVPAAARALPTSVPAAARALPTTVPAAARALPTTLPSAAPALQAELDLAQATIDAPSSPPASVASAAQFEQLATLTLGRRPRAQQRAIVSGLAPTAAGAMRTNLDARAALSNLTPPHRSLPPWRIEQPPAPDMLLGYFKAAQATYRVPWEYLAAIEFVETNYGRVHGLSTAGADGPMQFLPATWARYGRGNVRDPRDAVFAAARYLTANGAPGDMADALFHYNPSTDYVRAVTDYANRMRADQYAYYGYYDWQILYARRGRLFVLPVGYPTVRPIELTLPATPRWG